MFPGESNDTIEETLQASINVEDAVDKLLKSGTGNPCQNINKSINC